MMVRGDIPTLYKWIHLKLLERRGGALSKKEVIEIIRRNIRLPPKQLDKNIIEELVGYDLIIKLNHKRGYYITPDKCIVLDPFF